MERASRVTGKIEFPGVGSGFKDVHLIIIHQVILLLTGLFLFYMNNKHVKCEHRANIFLFFSP